MLLCIGSETYLFACNCLLGGKTQDVSPHYSLKEFMFELCAVENISTLSFFLGSRKCE